MKRVMRFIPWLVCIFVLFSMIGCAPTKKIWRSKPEVQQAENAYYDVKLNPLKNGHSFFTKFRLDVTNKTGGVLKIDWNKTKYIHNGRIKGVFVFKGINPSDIKNQTVPDDVINAGSNFSKVIVPYKLLARAPLRTNTLEESIGAGILPNGENGAHLVIKHREKEIIEKLSMIITETISQ